MKYAFTTWKVDGLRFLSAPCKDGVTIINELGAHYGDWKDVWSFRELQPGGCKYAAGRELPAFEGAEINISLK